MAKQSVNGFRPGHEPKVQAETENEAESEYGYSTPDVLITSKGAKVRLIGLNPARLERLQTAGKMPDVPYREIPNDLGAPQKENLSANDLQDDDERARWAVYLEECKVIEDKRNENVMKYIFTDGFDVDTSEIEEWAIEEVEEYGLEVSEKRIQRRMDFINAKVLGTAMDLGNIMAGVLERTGLPANMLDEVRDSFRGNIRQNTLTETDPEPEEVAGG